MKTKTALLFLFCISIITSCSVDYSSIRGNILFTGTFECFNEIITEYKGKVQNFSCESSAVIYDGKNIIIANDKQVPVVQIVSGKKIPVPEKLGHVFTMFLERDKISPKPQSYINQRLFKYASKYESMAITPDGKYTFAATAFDRTSSGSTELDQFNLLLCWKTGLAETVKILGAGEGRMASIKIIQGLKKGLKSSRYPDGPSYFKVEGLAVVPSAAGNKILFGIRELGESSEKFEYVFRVVSADIEMKSGFPEIGTEFRVVYDFNTSGLKGIKYTLGLSSLEYDKFNNRLYMLTSYEFGDKIGGYLWSIKLEDFYSGKKPSIVADKNGYGIEFCHKPEGLAVIDNRRVLIIYDDDRNFGRKNSSCGTRKANESFYSMMEISAQ